MRFLWNLIKGIVFLVFLAAIGAGFYAGNLAYDQLLNSPWDRILGVTNNKDDLRRIHRAEQNYGWQPVDVVSADGTKLHGTYIEDVAHGASTVILLHGLYQNRSMCIPYAGLYRNMGYNVLMIDQRGHGESGGTHTTWGMKETEDMDAWVDWLRAKNPSMRIGMHGISLGAAMALVYSGTEKGRQMDFYVADSSYGNLIGLGEDKLSAYTGNNRLVWGMDVLNPFFQSVMFIRDGKLLSDIDPLDTVKKMTSPVLFLHGGSDTLVPPKAAEELLQASGSREKELFIFQGAAHAMEMASNRDSYRENIRSFLAKIK